MIKSICFPVPNLSWVTKGKFGISEEEMLIVIKVCRPRCTYFGCGKLLIADWLVVSHFVKEGIKKKITVALSFFSLLGSWQFLTYSHQSRDKSTLGILKGFILCRESQQSIETSFCRMRRRGRVFLHLIFTHSRSQGYNRSAVLFLSWRGSKWHSTKSCLYSLTPFIFRAYKTSKVSIKWIFFNSWQSLLYLGSLLGALSLSLSLSLFLAGYIVHACWVQLTVAVLSSLIYKFKFRKCWELFLFE